MTEDLFRVVVTIAVALACIAFVVQAAVAVAFYSTVRKIREKVDHLIDRVEPVVGRVEPLMAKVEPIIDRAVPAIERAGPMFDSAKEAIERSKPLIDQAVQVVGKVGAMVERAGPVIDNARRTVASANRVIDDVRPRIVEMSDEAVGIVRSGREQVERIGGVLHEASDRARNRLEQIDESLENTVGQVGNVGGAMKRAVLRPVREANGLAAGISAAVSSLVHPRRADAATQDEEMFI